MENSSKRSSVATLGMLEVPDRYGPDDSEEDKVIYALSLIGHGTAGDVGIKISELDTSIEPGGFSNTAEPILGRLCREGLIGCHDEDDNPAYYFIN